MKILLNKVKIYNREIFNILLMVWCLFNKDLIFLVNDKFSKNCLLEEMVWIKVFGELVEILLKIYFVVMYGVYIFFNI